MGTMITPSGRGEEGGPSHGWTEVVDPRNREETPHRMTPSEARYPETHAPEALGDVARDVMDHVSILVRDNLKMGRLEARHYVEHLRHDVAPRVSYRVAAIGLAALTAVFALLALFLGIASALGSVAWTFAIYAAFFGVLAVVAIGMAGRTSERTSRRYLNEQRNEGETDRVGKPEERRVVEVQRSR